MGLQYEKEYEVHYYEVDSNLKCTLPAMMNYFTDVANKQSEALGVGIEYLNSKNLTWVFYRYDIKINRYPKYEEKLKVITKALAFKKFFASRGFEILDENNEQIVSGASIFLLIDTEKRRAVRIPEEQFVAYEVSSEEFVDTNKAKLEQISEANGIKEYNVRWSDIDSNKHVNNSKYVEWAIDSVPRDLAEKYSLSEISIVFEKECYYGDKVRALYEVINEDDGSIRILHKIESEDNTQLNTMVSKWILK